MKISVGICNRYWSREFASAVTFCNSEQCLTCIARSTRMERCMESVCIARTTIPLKSMTIRHPNEASSTPVRDRTAKIYPERSRSKPKPALQRTPIAHSETHSLYPRSNPTPIPPLIPLFLPHLSKPPLITTNTTSHSPSPPPPNPYTDETQPQPARP